MINTKRAELIADLRLNHEYCPKESILKASDMLEADAQELTRLRDLARDAANAATQLQKQVLLLRAQRVAVSDAAIIKEIVVNADYREMWVEQVRINQELCAQLAAS